MKVLSRECGCLLTTAKFTFLENPPPPGVDGATAMRILEEMERKEAADSDEDETTGTGAGKAS